MAGFVAGYRACWVLLAQLSLVVALTLGVPVDEFGNAFNITRRATSQDPSCPPGFLCQPAACPSNARCPAGEVCVNFEGALACGPAGIGFCSLNPDSLLAVGCRDGTCCHGQCYAKGVTCCNSPSTTCSLHKPCLVCPAGQSCAADGSCLNPITTTSSRSSTTTSNGPGITISVPTTTISSTSRTSLTSTTSTTSTSSSTTSVPTTTPTTVPDLGTYTNQGCYQDAPSARILVADELQDDAMTIEKCLQFARDGFWKYAGVEYTRECFVGNTLHDASQASPSDCNMPCGGNSTQICGGGNRINVYQDEAWYDPTLPQVIEAIKLYNATLAESLSIIHEYGEIVDLLDTYIKANKKLRRRTQSYTLTEIGTRNTNLVTRARQGYHRIENTATRSRSLATRNVGRDLPRTGDRIPESALRRYEELLRGAGRQVQTVIEDAEDTQRLIQDAVENTPEPPQGEPPSNPVPDVDVPHSQGLISTALSTLGTPGAIVGGVVIATGIFLGIAQLLGLFGGNNGGNPPEVTITSAAPSSTSTCSPTMLATPMVVLARRNTPPDAYDEILNLLPSEDRLVDETVFPKIGFRSFVANIDNCDAQLLLDNENVGAVSIDSREVHDPADSEDASSSLTRRSHPQGVRSEGDTIPQATFKTLTNATAAGNSSYLARRDSDPNAILIVQHPSPMHLRVLSAPWSKRRAARAPGTLRRTYKGYDDFVYAGFPNQNRPNIYIFDTGINPAHTDFKAPNQASRVIAGYHPRRRDSQGERGVEIPPEDLHREGGHGTRMASAAGGTFFGVAKRANLIDVHVSKLGDLEGSNSGGLVPTAISEFIRALAWSANRVVSNGEQGLSVFSMSLGYHKASMRWNPEDPDAAGPGKQNAIREAIEQYVYPSGIVLVVSGENDPTFDLADFEPKVSGGSDTGMIVVGQTDYLGEPVNYPPDSSGRSLLTLYAMGLEVCAADRKTETWWRCGTGCSPAAATVAGLAGYYLADPAVRAQMMAGGPQNVAANMKQFLIDLGRSRKGTGYPGQVAHADYPRVAIGEEIVCPDGGAALPPLARIPYTKELVINSDFGAPEGPNFAEDFENFQAPTGPAPSPSYHPYVGAGLMDEAQGRPFDPSRALYQFYESDLPDPGCVRLT